MALLSTPAVAELFIDVVAADPKTIRRTNLKSLLIERESA